MRKWKERTKNTRIEITNLFKGWKFPHKRNKNETLQKDIEKDARILSSSSSLFHRLSHSLFFSLSLWKLWNEKWNCANDCFKDKQIKTWFFLTFCFTLDQIKLTTTHNDCHCCSLRQHFKWILTIVLRRKKSNRKKKWKQQKSCKRCLLWCWREKSPFFTRLFVYILI